MNALLELVGTKVRWFHGDDACDCVFQRICTFENPYLGAAHQVRLCCVWAEIRKQYPEFFQDFEGEQQAWNGEAEMPRALWHRQVALATGKSLPEARDMLRESEPPKGVRRPVARRKRSWWERWL